MFRMMVRIYAWLVRKHLGPEMYELAVQSIRNDWTFSRYGTAIYRLLSIAHSDGRMRSKERRDMRRIAKRG